MLRGCTAVHYAAMQGYTECLRLLLKAGGRHDVLNNSGKSCHDVATKDCKLILDQQSEYSTILSPESLHKNVIVHINIRRFDSKNYVTWERS